MLPERSEMVEGTTDLNRYINILPTVKTLVFFFVCNSLNASCCVIFAWARTKCDWFQVRLQEETMPPHDKARESPNDPRIQAIRNHYINANYVRGFDGKFVLLFGAVFSFFFFRLSFSDTRPEFSFIEES